MISESSDVPFPAIATTRFVDRFLQIEGHSTKDQWKWNNIKEKCTREDLVDVLLPANSSVPSALFKHIVLASTRFTYFRKIAARLDMIEVCCLLREYVLLMLFSESIHGTITAEPPVSCSVLLHLCAESRESTVVDQSEISIVVVVCGLARWDLSSIVISSSPGSLSSSGIYIILAVC